MVWSKLLIGETYLSLRQKYETHFTAIFGLPTMNFRSLIPPFFSVFAE